MLSSVLEHFVRWDSRGNSELFDILLAFLIMNFYFKKEKHVSSIYFYICINRKKKKKEKKIMKI